MFVTAPKYLNSVLIFILAACASAQPVCPVDEIIVKGHMDHPPSNAKVRLQLMYAKNMPGEAGDITPESDTFTLPVDFLTQSRQPIVNGSFGKCGRKPTDVIVTLLDGKTDREYDRISLNFVKDFKKTDPSTYVKFDVVLKGPQ